MVKNEIDIRIARNIKRLRQERGLSRAELEVTIFRTKDDRTIRATAQVIDTFLKVPYSVKQ